MLKNLLLSFLSLVLVAGTTAPAMAYKYTMPTNPLYKYSTPSNPYKYTTPSNPLYKYTNPGTIYEDDEEENFNDQDCIVNPFSDIEGHPAQQEIVELTCMGLLRGYEDGTFRPDNTITRAEILKISMMAAGIEPGGGSTELDMYFADLDDWQAPWVNTSFELGIVEGYDSGDGLTYYYKPNNPVNRAEGIKIMLASVGIYPGGMEKSSFSDVSGWMTPWIEVAYGIGVIDMSSSGKFYPTSPLTRGDAAMYLSRLLTKAV